MKIELLPIHLGELVAGYEDTGEEGGAFGLGGKLHIRPPYQRAYIYKEIGKRDAVIHSVMNEFPIGTMYWFLRKDGDYELIDGQQRTVSLAQYIIDEDFAVKFNDAPKLFGGLPEEKQKQILNYNLFHVYVCEGTTEERLEWFKRINIQGEPLTPQELRNAMHAGKWTADAKRHFSKTGGPAYEIGKDYLTGSPIRQQYLETALKWISGESDKEINNYMATRHNETAGELWEHFKAVIDWVKHTFPKYRVEMKGLDWGILYNNHKDEDLDPAKLEAKCARLMEDEEVTKKRGVYFYLLTRNEKHLNLRAFSKKQKRELFEKADGKCQKCGAEIKALNESDADHIKPWSEGGKTDLRNGQILCRECNRSKSNK